LTPFTLAVLVAFGLMADEALAIGGWLGLWVPCLRSPPGKIAS
jgi:hypothetical protein